MVGGLICVIATLTQMMNCTSLNGYLDHLINYLTGFPLRINDFLSHFLITAFIIIINIHVPNSFYLASYS